VHCGLCLPACPTYTQTYNEADSPRGRIQLMLALSDGTIEPSESVRRHLDLCLDCRACETACPSSVVYHELIEETRARLSRQTGQAFGARLLRWMFFHVLVHPTRLKLALLPGRLARKMGLFNLLPAPLRKMGRMLPEAGPLWPGPLPEHSPSNSNLKSQISKATVAFFPGCVGSVMFDSVNRQAVELLNACGADVTVSRAQVCCGAIHHHNGDHHAAQELARKNIDAMLPLDGSGPEFITTTIAGCGAMLREYDLLLRDDDNYATRAKLFASKVRDISEVLLELDVSSLVRHAVDQTVTYHDACHLAHAQRVTTAPRKLLSKIPGLKVVPLPEGEICCGAAGTYNLTQPAMATELAQRKLRNIASTGASTCVMGNVGCAMHIRSEAAAGRAGLAVVHPVELLHRAVYGSEQATCRGDRSTNAARGGA
jgi:glycolate oxidase iron-sulfur subunit